MKILSLFDGMACGMIAFNLVGIEIDSYDAYEVDKYAIQTATHNYPKIKEHGDVFTADFAQYKGVDFVIGGSPCTYWSIAQNKNRETTASGMGWELFSQYVRAVKEAQPKYFIYENNYSMSKQIRESIDKAFGFEAVYINSALVSAQNRKRLYWVGKRNANGTYSKVDVKQPKDRGILLKDILESDAQRIPEYGNKDKARPILATYPHKSVGTDCFTDKPSKQVFDFVAKPIRVGALPRPNGELATVQSMQIYAVNGKSTTLMANGGGMGGKTGLYAVPTAEKIKSEIPIYEVKNGFITIKGKNYPIKLADGYYIIRKLTVTECKRLQTVPEWYNFPVSNAQAYKMLGNGWTVEVIAHLIKSALTGVTVERQEQLVFI